jgi:hypothetical protein
LRTIINKLIINNLKLNSYERKKRVCKTHRYGMSGNMELMVGAEGITDGAWIEDWNPVDNSGHMLEGINQGSIIEF